MDLELSISTPGGPAPSVKGRGGRKTSDTRAASSKMLLSVPCTLLVLTLLAFASVSLATLVLNGLVLTTRWQPHEPPLPGVMPGEERPKIILAADINYPPYARLGEFATRCELEDTMYTDRLPFPPPLFPSSPFPSPLLVRKEPPTRTLRSADLDATLLLASRRSATLT